MAGRAAAAGAATATAWYRLYSFWLGIWTALYLAGWAPLSPYPGLLASTLLLPLLYFGVRNINAAYLAFNFLSHVALLCLVRRDLSSLAVFGNICVFIVYATVLRLGSGTGVLDLYFLDVRRFLGRRDLSLKEYVRWL